MQHTIYGYRRNINVHGSALGLMLQYRRQRCMIGETVRKHHRERASDLREYAFERGLWRHSWTRGFRRAHRDAFKRRYKRLNKGA